VWAGVGIGVGEGTTRYEGEWSVGTAPFTLDRKFNQIYLIFKKTKSRKEKERGSKVVEGENRVERPGL